MRRLIWFAFVAVLLASCGAQAGQTTTTIDPQSETTTSLAATTTTSLAATTTTTPATTTTRAPIDPELEPLIGQWFVWPNRVPGALWAHRMVEFTTHGYLFAGHSLGETFVNPRNSGLFTLEDGVIETDIMRAFCDVRSGTYRVSVSGDQLTLTPIQDTCQNRRNLIGGTWDRRTQADIDDLLERNSDD